MKYHLVLICLISNLYQIHAQGQTFPESWDSARLLRGKHGVVLAWERYVDSMRGIDIKSCIVLKFYKDSIGDTTYFFTHQYLKNDSSGHWDYQMIHFGPGGDHPNIGFMDVHIHQFESRPDQSAIEALFKQWMINDSNLFDRNSNEIGYDKELWLKYLGFDPGKVF